MATVSMTSMAINHLLTGMIPKVLGKILDKDAFRRSKWPRNERRLRTPSRVGLEVLVVESCFPELLVPSGKLT